MWKKKKKTLGFQNKKKTILRYCDKFAAIMCAAITYFRMTKILKVTGRQQKTVT